MRGVFLANEEGDKPVNQNQPIGQGQDQVSGAAPSSDTASTEMSQQEIDAFLAEKAPEFVEQVKQIAEDKTLTLENIEEPKIDEALKLELEKWTAKGGVPRLIARNTPVLVQKYLQVKVALVRLKDNVLGLKVRFSNLILFLKNDGKAKAKEGFKNLLQLLKSKVNNFLVQFGKLSGKQKLQIFSGLVLVTAAIYVLLSIYNQKGLIPKEEELFVSDLALHATEVTSYDPLREVEPYYNNPRAALNLILIPKVVVNLKASKTSGPNPMLAAEFFIEGLSAEVVIEVKDREVYIRDIITRSLEEQTYDEIDSIEGKKEMTNKLLREINRVLTTGRIKNVRIKTIVIKP